MQIIVLQEPLHGASLVRVAVTENLGQSFLNFEGELILMAVGEEVECVAHAPQKVPRLEHRLELALAHHALLDDLPQRVDLVLYARHPKSRMEIPKAPFSFLHVRLEKVDRVAVLPMTVFALCHLLAEKFLGIAA